MGKFHRSFKTVIPNLYHADKRKQNRKEDLSIVKLSNYER
jgi:hypothetical protein